MFTESLCERVQHNCNIADARYAGNFTLCTYLMKMREYCRWEKGYAYTDVLSREEVGDWVSEREALWNELETLEFSPLEIDGKAFDPFDADAINTALQASDMVYSAGLGARMTPHFFLGRRDAHNHFDDYQVIIVAQECARDLGAPPAMTLQDKIFIRKESIRRMLWEKVQEWQWQKRDNAAGRAFSHYAFADNAQAALEQMTEVESNSILLHERGEIDSARQLGAQWKHFLATVSGMRLDLLLRSVKDCYADTLLLLPELLQSNHQASVHFYAANMSPLRKQLWPSFMRAYQQWCSTAEFSALESSALVNVVEESQAHWRKVCRQALQLHLQQAVESDIEQYIEQQIF